MKDLAVNGYPSKFIQQTSQLIETDTPSGLNNNTAGFTSLPYVKGYPNKLNGHYLMLVCVQHTNLCIVWVTHLGN